MERKILGCGFIEEFRGKSQSVYTRDKKFKSIKKAEPWERTCPQYFADSAFYNSVFNLVDDYEKNRLGNVLDLPNPLLTYLRVASAEMKRWTHFWNAENYNQIRKQYRKK